MRWVTREKTEVDRIEAAALGFRAVAKDDFDNMKLQFPSRTLYTRTASGRSNSLASLTTPFANAAKSPSAPI